MFAAWWAFLLVSTIVWQGSIASSGVSNDTSLALPLGNLTSTSGSNTDHAGSNGTISIDNHDDGHDGNLTYDKTLIQQYIIWPLEKISPSDSKSLEKYVNGLAPSVNNVYVSWSQEGEACFVVANLSGVKAAEARSHQLVHDLNLNLHVGVASSIEINSTENSIPRYASQFFPLASELRVLSQPRGYPDIGDFPAFVTRTDADQPTYLYHVEVGVNAFHPDFEGLEIEWLYPGWTKYLGWNFPGEMPPDFYPIRSRYGHSTATASKAIGRIYGSNRNRATKLVVVKMDSLSVAAMCEVFQTVWEDISQKGRALHSVLTVSWGWDPAPGEDPLRQDFRMFPGWFKMYDWLRCLTNAGVLVTVAAGNDALEYDPVLRRRRDFTDSVPAVLASLYRNPLPLVVVGGTQFDGQRWIESQKTAGTYGPQIHAPAYRITCAAADSSGYEILTGTSFAAPLVAGVIASLLATDQIDRNRPTLDKLRFIRTLAAYPRTTDGPPIIWNLVDAAHNPPLDGETQPNTSVTNPESQRFGGLRLPVKSNTSDTAALS